MTSGADSQELAWLDRGDGGEHRRHERAQVLHAIGSGTDDEYTERERRYLLLELDTAVHCDQNVVMATHPAQEFAILDTGPTAPHNRSDRMAVELRREIYR
jgi:hypothetical protein